MRTAVEYLRERGLLKDGFNKFVVSFEDGEQFDVVELIEEYASQKWISVEERLPTEEGLYLVFRKHPEKGTFMYEIEQYRMGKDGRFFWYDYLFITHWQPLPKSPEK